MDESFVNAPTVDLFTAGFPCQPFSQMGARAGPQDKRSSVIHQIIRYFQKSPPAIFVLENVRGLRTQHPEFFLSILDALQAIKHPRTQKRMFNVMWREMNSKEVGVVPQNRPRIYIVGARVSQSALTNRIWPSTKQTPSLRSILGTPRKKPQFPTAAFAKQHLRSIFKELADADVMPSKHAIAIDCHAVTPRWWLDLCPCITAKRGSSGGFFITSQKRMLTVPEMMRLQGMTDVEELAIICPAHSMGFMVGNAFTQSVFERLLLTLLPRILPGVKLRDRFQNCP